MDSIPIESFDDVDQRLLARLMREGRATWADLAHDLGLTAPAVAQRVRRLEERGVIRHFTAWVNPASVAPVAAYVTMKLAKPALREKFERKVDALEAVQECSRISGDDDYLLKVRCTSLDALDRFLIDSLGRLPGAGPLRSQVVLSSVKDTPALPLPNGRASDRSEG